MQVTIGSRLAKAASKEASHLPLRRDISLSKVKETNRQITLDKCGGTWENTIFDKHSVPENSLRHRFLQLKETARKGPSKVV